MIISCTYVTSEAVYEFQVNNAEDCARVTRWVRKGQKGYDQSTSMSVGTARKFAKQLQAK
jgi:hypothetical protein